MKKSTLNANCFVSDLHTGFNYHLLGKAALESSYYRDLVRIQKLIGAKTSENSLIFKKSSSLVDSTQVEIFQIVPKSWLTTPNNRSLGTSTTFVVHSTQPHTDISEIQVTYSKYIKGRQFRNKYIPKLKLDLYKEEEGPLFQERALYKQYTVSH